MNSTEFDAIVAYRIDRIKLGLTDKGKEYSSPEDTLHNFKAASYITGQSPNKTLWGFLAKHLVSVFDNLDSIPDEKWINEKIGDCINYFILLEALMLEDLQTTTAK